MVREGSPEELVPDPRQVTRYKGKVRMIHLARELYLQTFIFLGRQ